MRSIKARLKLLSALVPAAAAFSAYGTASAQLDVITVTATKSEKSLQEVPLSIEAVSGEFLEDFVVDDFKSLSDNIPTLVVSTGLTSTNVSLRGLGSGQERGFEQSVGMFIDGQYMPRSRQYRAPFFDVERVEVVKGPQAVYFGLNSTAGAVSVATRRARRGEGFDAWGAVNVGLEFGGQEVEGAVSYGGERAGVRVAGKYSNMDGYFENQFLNTREGDTEDILVRGTAFFDVTDTFRLSGKVEISDFEMRGNIGEIFDTGIETSPPLAVTDNELNYIRSSDGTTIPAAIAAGIFPEGGPGTFSKSNNYLLTAEWDVGGGTITATGGISDFEFDFNVDLDTNSQSAFDAAIIETYNQKSVDLRYQSDASKAFRVIVGGYFQDTEWFNLQPTSIGLEVFGVGANAFIASLTDQATADLVYPAGQLLMGGSDSEINSTLFSAYGALEYDLSDRVTVTAGGRWVTEDKDLERENFCVFTDPTGTTQTAPASVATLDAFNLCPNQALDGLSPSRSSDNFLPEGSIQFRPSDEVTLFARAGKSAKAGGFATSGNIEAAFLEFDDESVVGVEAGFKSTLFDGRAQFNVTGFWSRFKDLQVNSFIVSPNPPNLPVPVLDNAARATTQGVEIDGRLFINDSITVGGTAAYLNAEYNEFPSAPCNRADSAAPDGVLPNTCNFSGRETPFAPDFSGNIHMNLDHDIGGGFAVIGNAKLAFSSSYFTDGTLEEPGRQGAWQKVDASIGIAHDTGWELSVIGTNLTDEAVLGTSQGFQGALLGYLEQPRQVLIRAKWQLQ